VPYQLVNNCWSPHCVKIRPESFGTAANGIGKVSAGTRKEF
jgi:hypothetical protein